jgi:Concanavalin A-like lectin/glucanases superfamily/PA14 domain/Bacterial TSP3 repeat
MKKLLLLILPLAMSTIRPASAGDLLVWWNFDTTAPGVSIDAYSGYLGRLLNGAQYTTAGGGRSGTGADRGMLFGNDRHRMYVPDAEFLNVAGAVNNVSVSFWQNLGEQRDQYTFYAATAGIAQAFSSHSPWSDGQIYWDTAGCCDASTQRIQAAPGIQWLSAWHHIVLVKNGDTKRIYLDGAELINGINTAPMPTDFTDMYIGNHPGAANAVSGVLDDFAIFKRELSPAEVTALYGGATPASLEPSNDTDTDSLPDAWELRFAADLTVIAAGGDADTDTLSNEAELAQGTNPNNNDTDGDGALDGSETGTGVWVSLSNRGTNPFVGDTDNDGLLDGVEDNTGTFVDATHTGSNPLVGDTDGDGVEDGYEVTKGTSPTNPSQTPLLWTVRNARSGGVLNSIASVRNLFGPGGNPVAQTTTSETVINFDENVGGGGAPFQPQNPFPVIGTMGTDTNFFAVKANGTIAITSAGLYTFGFSSDDGGGIYIDGQPVVVFDADRGTGTSLGAVYLGVGPHRVEFLYWENGGGAQCQVFAANTKGDFTGAGADNATIQANYHLLETSVFNLADTDSDGLPDGWETAFFPGDLTKLGAGDFDSDTVNDTAEYTNGTDPTKPDTDDDGLTDAQEITATTNPLDPDTDNDGLLDGVEDDTGVFVDAGHTGTDPKNADSDGDKWPDGVEVGWPSNPNLNTSQPSVNPGQLDLLAYWSFDDNSDPRSSRDLVHGFPANFLGSTAYSAAGAGAHGTPTDRAMNLGNAGGTNGADVPGARWFGLGVPPPIVFNNLGSVGADANMAVGGATAPTPGALAGSADTAMTTVAPNAGTGVGYHPALNPNGPFTAEAWLKPAAAMNPGQLLCAISCGDFAAPRKGWLVYQSDLGWNFRTYYNDGLSTAVNITGDNGAAPLAGVWTHVAVTWDGSLARVYVDGALRITSDPRPYVPGIAGRFTVGARSDAGFQWSGDVDEVAFYGTALSDAVVAQHYANGANPTPPQSYDSLVLASNPIGYWRMVLSDPDPPGPDQVAVSYWQNVEFVSDSSAFWAASPSSNNGERGFQAHVPWSDGNIYFDTAGCCDPPQRLVTFGNVQTGVWEHFVFQKDGQHKEVWKNGVKIIEGDGFATLPNDFTHLTIGAISSGAASSASAMRGMIDDFAVFGDPLTPAQIEQLATGASPPSLLLPLVPVDVTQFQLNSPLPNQATITWASIIGKTYTLRASLTLAQPSWIEVNSNIPSGGASTTYVHNLLSTFPGGAPRRLFYLATENP